MGIKASITEGAASTGGSGGAGKAKRRWHAPALKRLDVGRTANSGSRTLEAGHDDPNRAS